MRKGGFVLLLGSTVLAGAALAAQMPAPQDARWEVPRGGAVKIVGDQGNRYAVFRSQRSNQNLVMATRFRLNPQWKRLTVSARVRLQRYRRDPKWWNRAGFTLSLQDARKRRLWVPEPEVKGNTNGKVISTTFDVPASARQMMLSVGLWGAAGVFVVDDVKVIANPQLPSPRNVLGIGSF